MYVYKKYTQLLIQRFYVIFHVDGNSIFKYVLTKMFNDFDQDFHKYVSIHICTP